MIENLLKYQKLDSELYRVEQKLTNGEYKKKATELSTVAKKAQARSADLEMEAEKLIAEIDDIKKKYNINKAKLEESQLIRELEKRINDIKNESPQVIMPKDLEANNSETKTEEQKEEIRG